MKSTSLLTLALVAIIPVFGTIENSHHHHHHHSDAEHMRIAHGVYREASEE
jgi:hypothetical protein